MSKQAVGEAFHFSQQMPSSTEVPEVMRYVSDLHYCLREQEQFVVVVFLNVASQYLKSGNQDTPSHHYPWSGYGTWLYSPESPVKPDGKGRRWSSFLKS
jgi:hypothetical protein